MIYRDLKKSDNMPYKISPNTDVSVAENGPMLSNRQPIHFLITFKVKLDLISLICRQDFFPRFLPRMDG